MIDYVKLRFLANFPPEILDRRKTIVEFQGQEYYPKFSASGEVHHYSRDVDNLKKKLQPYDGSVQIENSLHKFFHGHNYNDFFLSEVESSINRLASICSLNPQNTIIKGLEYGCNVVVKDVHNVLNGLVSNRNKAYQPMVWNGLKYGVTCQFGQYSIKAYNKTQEAKIHYKVAIPENTLRWEIRIKKMPALHKRSQQIPIFHLQDLAEYEKVQYLAEDILMKFRSSVKRSTSFRYSELSTHQLGVIGAMQNEDVINALKTMRKSSYRSYTSEYKKLLKNAVPFWEGELEVLLGEKCRELLNG